MGDIALRSQARTLADARAVIDAGKVLFSFSREVWVSVEGVVWVGDKCPKPSLATYSLV